MGKIMYRWYYSHNSFSPFNNLFKVGITKKRVRQQFLELFLQKLGMTQLKKRKNILNINSTTSTER